MALLKGLRKGEGLQASTKATRALLLVLILGCSAIVPVHALRSNISKHPVIKAQINEKKTRTPRSTRATENPKNKQGNKVIHRVVTDKEFEDSKAKSRHNIRKKTHDGADNTGIAEFGFKKRIPKKTKKTEEETEEIEESEEDIEAIADEEIEEIEKSVEIEETDEEDTQVQKAEGWSSSSESTFTKPKKTPRRQPPFLFENHPKTMRDAMFELHGQSASRNLVGKKRKRRKSSGMKKRGRRNRMKAGGRGKRGQARSGGGPDPSLIANFRNDEGDSHDRSNNAARGSVVSSGDTWQGTSFSNSGGSVGNFRCQLPLENLDCIATTIDGNLGFVSPDGVIVLPSTHGWCINTMIYNCAAYEAVTQPFSPPVFQFSLTSPPNLGRVRRNLHGSAPSGPPGPPNSGPPGPPNSGP
eukprot:scaffold1573_cov68-Attheya_sp.AAC.1